jgi:hypothetical protein
MPDSPQVTAQPVPAAPGSVVPVHNRKRPDMTWRDHLVMLLRAGAEAEHALMVQYLFAAYSIKVEQPSPELCALMTDWRASILSVAREEMGHLLTVQNVLTLLGAPVHLGRDMSSLWDHEFVPFKFSLEPLSIETLQRFIYVEMPKKESLKRLEDLRALVRKRWHPRAVQPPKVPELEKIIDEVSAAVDAANAHRVGDLYDEIIELISNRDRIPDSEFNEATYDRQASWDDWARGYKPEPREVDAEGGVAKDDIKPLNPLHHHHSADREHVSQRDAYVQVERAASRAQARKALRALAAQGEAPHLRKRDSGEPSHFERFVEIYRQFKEQAGDPSFKATYAVPRNPTTREDFHKNNPDSTYIPLEPIGAHYFAQLFNQRYRLLLAYLAHSFHLARTQPAHEPNLRAMVMHRAFGEMYNLKAIAGLLVRLSVDRKASAEAGCGAPPFELPHVLELPHAERDIWRQLDDLIASSQHTCSEMFRLPKNFEAYAADGREIEAVGGYAYLRTLMDLDVQTRRWIGKIIAGAA